MRRTPGVVALTALVVALAGCSDPGGDEPQETPSSEASASDPASTGSTDEASPSDEETLPETSQEGVPAAVEEGVLDRLAAADGTFGTAPDTDPQVLGLEEFNAGAPQEQIDALEERGFVAGAFEQLKVPRTADAIRVVIGFESAAGAKADVRSGIEDQPGEGQVEKFAVPGIPGAEGFDVFGQQGLIGRNVAFNVGEYEYIVGVATQQPPSKPQVSQASLARAAKDWYDEARALD